MAKEITPALTPEEWGQKWFRCGDMDIQVHSDSIDLTWGVSRYDSVRIGEATPAEQLKLAARILHGHPQGFTRADWWQVDQAAMDAEELNRPEVQVAALRSLAARIEALLPPEGA